MFDEGRQVFPAEFCFLFLIFELSPDFSVFLNWACCSQVWFLPRVPAGLTPCRVMFVKRCWTVSAEFGSLLLIFEVRPDFLEFSLNEAHLVLEVVDQMFLFLPERHDRMFPVLNSAVCIKDAVRLDAAATLPSCPGMFFLKVGQCFLQIVFCYIFSCYLFIIHFNF